MSIDPGPRGSALVTGAGRRIGRALALALAGAGYDIAVHHRSGRQAALAVAEEITALGRSSVVLAAELRHDDEARALVAQAGRALGPLTLLVNNAAAFQDDRLATMTDDSWDTHIAANLRSPMVLSQAFAAQLPPEVPDGVAMILNMLDQRVLKPNPQFFSYGLSKAALWNATRTLAQALAPRIRVNGIGPGPTLASVHQDGTGFAAEAAATPLGRGADPRDICDAALYLVGARAVTGQMIAVDGGQHLAWRTPDIVGD